jgi:hypothetical protein
MTMLTARGHAPAQQALPIRWERQAQFTPLLTATLHWHRPTTRPAVCDHVNAVRPH